MQHCTRASQRTHLTKQSVRGAQNCPAKAPGHLSTEFALKGAELSHCLKGAGSSEAVGQFQHTAHLREHTSPSGAPQTTIDIRISHSGGQREGKTMWSLVSTTVYELEQKPSCRMHFDLSWWPHGEFSRVTP